MPPPVRGHRAAEWAARLHLSNGNDKAAVVVLGVLGCVNPQDLAPATAKLVAQALCRLVSRRSGRTDEVVIAAELIARGFYLFCPHIEDDLPKLIQDLIIGQASAESALGPAASAGGDPQNLNTKLAQQQQSVSSACQRALTEIGSAKTQLLLNTIGQEALRPGMHRAALMALSSFIKKRPVVLMRYLPVVIEVIIKTLDPSESDLRKACLKFSTILLHQLVKRYPMVAFHQNTQRFAVGTVQSVILVYDLRTATKWRILEGHKGPISALAFEPRTGENILSYCASESAVRLWQTGTSSGIFSFLGIQGSCLRTFSLPGLRLENPTTSADIIHNCAILDWNTLCREDASRFDLSQLLK